MKLRLEVDTDSPWTTKVYMNEIDVSNEISRIAVVQHAGESAEIWLCRINKDKDGRPYIDSKTGDLAREIIYSPRRPADKLSSE